MILGYCATTVRARFRKMGSSVEIPLDTIGRSIIASPCPRYRPFRDIGFRRLRLLGRIRRRPGPTRYARGKDVLLAT